MENALAEAKIDSKSNEEYSATDGLREQTIVEDFFARLKFFPPNIRTVTRIFLLNRELSDSYIEKELTDLSQTNPISPEDETPEIDKNWVSTVMERVSAILFHEDEPDAEQPTLSGMEMFRFFQKTLSERIYNHLSMLSRSPHAKKGKPFSIKEELTEEIAEKIGLGLYLKPETPVDLREGARNALLDLAWEFQQWLKERGGIYTATWGEIRLLEEETTIAEATSRAVVLLVSDVESQGEEPLQAATGYNGG